MPSPDHRPSPPSEPPHGQTDPEQRRWYVRREGRLAGPFASGVVRRLLLEEQVRLTDEVSADRVTWHPLAQVPEVVPPQLRRRQGESPTPVKTPPPVLAIGLSLVLVGGLLGFALWWGGRPPEGTPNCAAPAAPGVDWRNCRLAGLQAKAARLAGARAQNADLSEARLAGADLSGATLDYGDLRRADLGYALLRSASLRGANLRGADLTNADLSQADLSFADLSQAVLGDARLDGARLDGALWLDGTPCATGSLGGCMPAPAAR